MITPDDAVRIINGQKLLNNRATLGGGDVWWGEAYVRCIRRLPTGTRAAEQAVPAGHDPPGPQSLTKPPVEPTCTVVVAHSFRNLSTRLGPATTGPASRDPASVTGLGPVSGDPASTTRMSAGTSGVEVVSLKMSEGAPRSPAVSTATSATASPVPRSIPVSSGGVVEGD